MCVSSQEDRGGLIAHFFGKDADKRMKLEDFAKFLHDLHEELVLLEFRHYEGNDKVCAIIFCK